MAWAEAYLHTKWHLNPSSRLATTDMGRKLGGCAPLGERELCPHQTQCGQGWGLPASQVSSWSIQPFGHNTSTSETGPTGQDNGPIAYGEPFYKRSPKENKFSQVWRSTTNANNTGNKVSNTVIRKSIVIFQWWWHWWRHLVRYRWTSAKSRSDKSKQQHVDNNSHWNIFPILKTWLAGKNYLQSNHTETSGQSNLT